MRKRFGMLRSAPIGTPSLLSGLTAFWPLDGSSREIISGSAMTDTARAFSALPNSPMGGDSAFYLGSTKYVAVDSTLARFRPTTAMSVGGWLSVESVASAMGAVSNFEQSSSAIGGWTLIHNGVNGWQFYVGNNTNLTSGSGYAGAALPTAEKLGWRHVFGTYDGTNVRLYFDGVLVSTVAYSATIAYQSTTRMQLGCRYFTGSGDIQLFSGSMAQIGIWNRTLSLAEIQSLYNSGLGNNYPFNGAPVPLIGRFSNMDILDLRVANVLGNGSGADITVVGGGGGGGGASFAGGGGGGLVVEAFGVTLSAGTNYAVTVGAGGAGGGSGGANGAIGGASSFVAIVADGGGFGATYGTGTNGHGGPGGSGGGSAANTGTVGGRQVDNNSGGGKGYGFSGANGSSLGGSGGGGAGGFGTNGATGTAAVVAGGAGRVSPITGSTYGAGGRGSISTALGSSGTANTGNGGDGGGGSTAGGSGGSGVVVIRYLGASRGTGGTITTVGSFTVHTFTASGTLAIT